jgi:hypothetical protein
LLGAASKFHDTVGELGHGRARGLLLTNSSDKTSVHSQPKQESRMTDDFIILSDAELDQVSGSGNPYAPPAQTHYHGPEKDSPRHQDHRTITPFRNVSFYSPFWP